MNIEDDILIERFLKDLLPKEEKEQVLHRIKTDNAFKDKVDFERELFESLDEDDWHFIEHYNKEQVEDYTSILRSKELKDLKEELKRVNEKQKELEVSSKHINWKRILVSSAAILAIMFSVYMFTNDNVSSQDLYVEYFDVSELPSLVSRDDSNNQLAKAQLLFEDANYNDALQLLNKEATNKDNVNGSLLIYKGVSEMQLGNFNDAKSTFDSLINSDFLDAEKGYWYKALLYLKQDDKEMARQILEGVVAQSYFNTENAKMLLSKLD